MRSKEIRLSGILDRLEKVKKMENFENAHTLKEFQNNEKIRQQFNHSNVR